MSKNEHRYKKALEEIGSYTNTGNFVTILTMKAIAREALASKNCGRCNWFSDGRCTWFIKNRAPFYMFETIGAIVRSDSGEDCNCFCAAE